MDETAQFAVLLRSAAELYYRSYRVHQYLNVVARVAGNEYVSLARTLGNALTEARSNLDRLLTRWFTYPLAESNRQLLDLLGRFASAFAAIHETLIYLPSAGVQPETIGFLKATFTRHYPVIDPSIILGSAFNAFHFDFSETLGRVLPDLKNTRPPSQRNTVLQNPICDWQSPVGWAVLAHEMGHAIDLEHNLSRSVATQLSIDNASPQYDWLRELCADVIAGEMVGPAAIVAIVSIEYTLYPLRRVHTPSERTDRRPSHPTTMWRLRVVAEHLARKYSVDYLRDTLAAYQDAWEFSLVRSAPASNHDSLRYLDALQYRIYVSSCSDELRSRVSDALDSSHLVAEDSVKRCLKRLRRGDPIGAQGRPREELQQQIATYRSQYSAACDLDGNKRVVAFGELVKEFAEDPLPMQSLLLCCALRREELIRQAIEQSQEVDFVARFETLNRDLAVLDRRALSSVTSNLTQRALNQGSGA